MRKETLATLLGLSFLAPLHAYATDQVTDQPTQQPRYDSSITRQYLGGEVSWVLYDKDRNSQRHGGGYNGFYGRQLTDHFWWESSFGFYKQPTDLPTNSDYFQYHLMTGLSYAFGDRRGFTPYLLAQIGAIRHEVMPVADNSTNFGAIAGAGLLSPSLFDNGVRIRLEGSYAYDPFDGSHATNSWDQGAFGDLRASIGLEFPLGRTRIIVREKTIVKTHEVTVNAPFVDSDKDGVADDRDQCPNTLAGAKVDAHGCLIPDQNVVLKDILFELGSDKLTDASMRNLHAIAASLASQPEIHIEVAGNTDSTGNDDYNLKLSQKRAESVRNFLIQQGIKTDHLSAKGYGETNPIASNTSASGRAMNRRVELHISKQPNS